MNPQALRRARELRSLSANALAAEVGVSQSIISQIETGRVRASEELTKRVAHTLRVPVGFITRAPRLVTEGSLGGLFRAYTSKVTKGDVARIRQEASVLLEFVDRLADGYIRPEVAMPRQFGGEPVEVARRVRSAFGYPPEQPIGNLTSKLEKLGATIVKSELKRDAVFGFSTWDNGQTPRPFFMLGHFQTAFRLRWSLAHELGHIVLGHESQAMDPKEADTEADAFAGAFLVPADSLAEDLEGGVSLSALGHLKARYGVSLSALMRRCLDSGLVDRSKYESLNVQISQMGWRKSEPGDEVATHEEPRLLRQLVEARFGRDADRVVVAEELSMPEDVVTACLMTSREYLEVDRLRSFLELDRR